MSPKLSRKQLNDEHLDDATCLGEFRTLDGKATKGLLFKKGSNYFVTEFIAQDGLSHSFSFYQIDKRQIVDKRWKGLYKKLAGEHYFEVLSPGLFKEV